APAPRAPARRGPRSSTSPRRGAPCARRRSRSRALPRHRAGNVQPALGLRLARPAALAAGAGERAVGAAAPRVAAVVPLVVRQLALADVVEAALVVPVGERARLPQLVRLVPADLGRIGARRRLVAAQARDPRVEVGERPGERLDLANRAAERRVALPELVPV